jgi:hypothetical protein
VELCVPAITGDRESCDWQSSLVFTFVIIILVLFVIVKVQSGVTPLSIWSMAAFQIRVPS